MKPERFKIHCSNLQRTTRESKQYLVYCVFPFGVKGIFPGVEDPRTIRGKTSLALPLFTRHLNISSHRGHAKNSKKSNLYQETNLQQTEDKGMTDTGRQLN